jgi:molybdate transport system substrate-binding protein
MYRAWLLRGFLAAVLAGPAAAADGRTQPRPSPLTVFAASDLGPAFTQIVAEFERQTRIDVTLVLGSTGMLAQQIRNGAPADVFFAANQSFITDLAAENLTVRETHSLYARGRIAIVALTSSGARIESLTDLTDARIRRIAIANPQHAPYGLAARQALEAAGLWKTLEPKVVFGENVQQAVQFVRSGSAQAGLVARSVADTPDLRWTLIDGGLHAPLDQMAVVLARTKQPSASRSFIEFVNGTHGRPVMRRFGFLLPGESF